MRTTTAEQVICTSATMLSLEDVLRQGAQKMLAAALEAEVDNFLERYKSLKTESGHQGVVRNGYAPERHVQTGLGPMKVQRPKVRAKVPDEDGQPVSFTSKILPAWLRRTKSIDELIPWLYLRGISTGDFSQSLQSLLGPDAPGLSATNVCRLKESWMSDFTEWSKRDLSEKEYVYFWVDGIHFNIRLEGDKHCILVVIGATKDGNKELVAVQDGFRESTESWNDLLLQLKGRGLKAPNLAIGDGALGFWNALEKVYPQTKQQNCWVHKTANVLNKLPKTLHITAKRQLHEIYMAPTEVEAHKALDRFVATYQDKYPKATASLTDVKDRLLSFYRYPGIHWQHIRSTNPIESTFATVRLRTKRTKGAGSTEACLTMVFKLVQCAEKRWRKLQGYQYLTYVTKGEVFVDGNLKNAA